MRNFYLVLAQLFFILPTMGQTSDFLIPTQRDQGFFTLGLVESNGFLYTSGYDLPMFGQDTSLYPLLQRVIIFDPVQNSIVLDSIQNLNLNSNLGFLLHKTDTSFIASRLIDDSSSSTGLRFTLIEVGSQLNFFQEVFTFDFEISRSGGPRPFYWQQIDSVAYFHLNGDTNIYVIGPGFTILDTITVHYPNNTERALTPIYAHQSGTTHYIFQGISEWRTSNCFPNPCNRLDIRRITTNSGVQQQLSLPATANFQPTGSPFFGVAFKNTDLKRFASDTIIGIAQANSHNRPPFVTNSSFDIAMSNQVVLFKVPTNMDASGIQMRHYPSQSFPMYVNDETSMDFKYNDYIYVVATQVHDYNYFTPNRTLPYWSYVATGIETSLRLLCLDRNLNIRWDANIYDAGTEKHLVDIVALPDSGVALLMHESSPTGFTNPMNLRLMVFDKLGTGVHSSVPKEVENMPIWKVFPNPAHSELFVEATHAKRVRMMDAVGKLILETVMDDTQLRLDIGQLTKGIYFVQLEFHNGKVETKKVVVTR